MIKVYYRTNSKARWLLWTVADDKSAINEAVRWLRAGGAGEIQVTETKETVIFHWERDNGVLARPNKEG